MATPLSISPIAAEFQMSLLMLESMKADDDGIPEDDDSVANYSCEFGKSLEKQKFSLTFDKWLNIS